jgi:hypothetical protein
MFFVVAAAAALSMIATTGCDIDAEIGNLPVVDGIYINPEGRPEGWIRDTDAAGIYYYARVSMPEITPVIFERGAFTTYYKYMIGNVATQEPLPVEINEVVDQDSRYSYTIYCEYAVGQITIIARASDGGVLNFTDTMYFRTVIIP